MYASNSVLFVFIYTYLLCYTTSEGSNDYGVSLYPLEKSEVSCNKNTSFQCPIFTFCDSVGKCSCPKVPNDILKCDKNGVTEILAGYCITYESVESVAEVGICPYIISKNIILSDYVKLPRNLSEWNEFMCGRFNRQGTLCGQCKDGYYTSVYSYDLTCVKCPDGSSNWLKFIFIAFVPLTFFYIVILVFRINVHSTYLQSYVLYSQSVSCIPLARTIYQRSSFKPTWLKYIIYSLGSLYSMWNLDFFRFFNHSICFQVSALTSVSLDLLVAVYPLVLILVSYVLICAYDRKVKLFVIAWRPFQCFFKRFEGSYDVKNSLIDAFSSFFYLISSKCLNTCIDFLIPVKVYQFSDPKIVNFQYRLLYNPSLPYFGKHHLPYGTLALLVCGVSSIVPIILLLVYSNRYFQKIFHLILPQSWVLCVNAFVDSIQGVFKDGTEDKSWDFRWFSGIIVGARLIFLLGYGITLDGYTFILSANAVVIFLIICILVEPYKHRFRSLLTHFTVHVLATACVGTVSIIEENKYKSDAYFSNGFIVILAVFPTAHVVFVSFLTLLRSKKQ